jgi:uncharacterized membrane protein
MMKLRASWFLVLFSVVCGGCGGDDDEALPSVDCDAEPIPAFGEVTAFDTCAGCHSSNLSGSARQSAPSSINFDNHDSASLNADLAVKAVNRGSMPPASANQLTAAQKDALQRWALCGTPM